MKQLTIVREDGTVLIDGIGYYGLDLSALPEDVHAVQWHGEHGEVELVAADGRATENRRIDSLADFQPALDAWQAAHDEATRPPTLEELAARKRAEIDTARDAAFAAGLEYEIAGVPDVVQTRPQDQVNLLGLSAKAQLTIASGEPDTIFTFRGLSNTNRELTAVEMDELALAALAHIESIYQRSWERKDAIDAILADEVLDDAKRQAIEAVEW